jgi:uncharacterized protein (DUF433 family)
MPRTTKAPPRKNKPPKGEPVFVGEHMVVDPRICFGRLTFKGTRVWVETILHELASGRSIRSIRQSWPEVSREAITETVNHASTLLIQCYPRNGK